MANVKELVKSLLSPRYLLIYAYIYVLFVISRLISPSIMTNHIAFYQFTFGNISTSSGLKCLITIA